MLSTARVAYCPGKPCCEILCSTFSAGCSVAQEAISCCRLVRLTCLLASPSDTRLPRAGLYMFGLASALTAGPAAHWTTGELIAHSSAAWPGQPCPAWRCAMPGTADSLPHALPAQAACVCRLRSHCVDTAQERHSLPGPPAGTMNFVIFPFAFFAGGIIPLVGTCCQRAGCAAINDSTHSKLSTAWASCLSHHLRNLLCCLTLQLCAIIEIIRNNLFAAVTFTTYGTFYLVSSSPTTQPNVSTQPPCA